MVHLSGHLHWLRLGGQTVRNLYRLEFKFNLDQSERKSSARKKMTAVHFTTIPCEPNTVWKVQGKSHIVQYLFVHVLSKLCMLGLKVLKDFLWASFKFQCNRNIIMCKCTSHHLFSYGRLFQVNASAHKAWPNAVARRQKFSTCI